MDEISAMDYRADNGQIYREMLLTKMQTMDLMTGFNECLNMDSRKMLIIKFYSKMSITQMEEDRRLILH